MDSSGSSQAANGTGRLPCLRRLNRSSSAAATTAPSMTSVADGAWNRALTQSTSRVTPEWSRSPIGDSLLDGAGQNRFWRLDARQHVTSTWTYAAERDVHLVAGRAVAAPGGRRLLCTDPAGTRRGT